LRGVSYVKRVVWLLIVTTLFALPCIADEAYHQAKSNIENGRINLALEQLNRAVKRDANDYRAWFLLGVAYTRGQQFHQAMEAFRRVIEINPELAEPHNNLAVIYNALGDYRAAAGELETSLLKKPDYAVAEENLADIYLKLALENYRSALEKAPHPTLEQRYMRLLKVRDPKISSDFTEERVLVAVPAVKTKAVKEKLLEAVEQWRKAWSERDLDKYFSMYDADFRVPKRFASIKSWKRYKHRAISSKSYIQVDLSDLKITIDSSKKRAIIDFFQKFRSNSYNGDDLKRLEMKLHNGKWKIVSEDSVL